MHFRTIDECYDKGLSMTALLEVVSSSIFALYNAIAGLIVIFNTFAYTILIITSIFHFTRWYSLLYLTIICLIELFSSKYIRTHCFNSLIDCKMTIAKNILEHCDEYVRIEEWEQKAILKKMLEEYMGVSNLK